MINFKNDLKNDVIISQERVVVDEYNASQNNIKNELDVYIKEINDMSFNDKSFKILLLNDFNNAIGQIENNIQDLQSLNDILDILETQKEFMTADILIYNKLLAKVEKNMILVTNIIEKSLGRFDNVNLSDDDSTVKYINKMHKALLKLLTPNDKKSKKAVAKTKDENEKTIKKVSDYSSSDLICFFPKTEADNLVISTMQDSYKISFVENLASISIKLEDFNMSLKTAGVQISNSETNNVLLVSYVDKKYILLTNDQMEIPPFIKICKIAKKDDFIEVEIYANKLNLYIEDNIIGFNEGTITDTSKNYIPSVEDINNIINDYKNDAEVAIDEVANKTESVKPENSSDNSVQEEDTTEKDDNELKDNDTLTVSDSKNTVILPYKISDLEAKMKKSKKYKTLKDVINAEYTLPLELFKNPVRSRFREAFQLIKKKEHGSIREAISLGFELMFESNLNPAIIAACRNLDELDIYLDCLDDNELEKFSCFKINYQIAPDKQKNEKGKK